MNNDDNPPISNIINLVKGVFDPIFGGMISKATPIPVFDENDYYGYARWCDAHGYRPCPDEFEAIILQQNQAE